MSCSPNEDWSESADLVTLSSSPVLAGSFLGGDDGGAGESDVEDDGVGGVVGEGDMVGGGGDIDDREGGGGGGDIEDETQSTLPGASPLG